MAGHVVNSRRANLRSSSVNGIPFFNGAPKVKKNVLKHLKLSAKKSFWWLWNEILIRLSLAMKRNVWTFRVFQAHKDSCRFGKETVRDGAGAGWEGTRGGCEFEVCHVRGGQAGFSTFLRVCGGFQFCECRVKANKNFNPRRTAPAGWLHFFTNYRVKQVVFTQVKGLHPSAN